ncbi:hypothetical protein QTG54_002061 [Skeletonema marinoi]|uniref:Uncharacterized protein n=1 Tax=Skeletonema marinoi TaxID=267567 RepID=A0AAD8YII2_9STRA|nr:hypothetical protein QTG54_002061 [Skeletonema marinoi]
MKLTLTTLAAVLGLTTAADITTHSKMGQTLLSSARRVDTPSAQRALEGGNENGEVDYTWVANYSLKFQGCHNIPRWNEDADGEDDVRVSNTALVRFRLCPSNDCSTDSAYGMDTYLNAYFESVQQDQEYNCEYAMNYECNCAEGGDDNYSEEMWYGVLRGEQPLCRGGAEEEEKQDIREMAECQQFEAQNNNNNNNNNNGGEQVEYFMGPHCSDDGSAIRMGLFTDDECTIFADSNNGATTYASLTYGASMPYATTTLVGTECMSCKEPQDADQNNNNDQQDADEVKEGCEQLYEASAKCEAGLSGSIQYPDNSGCNFMQGIKIIRKNGNVYSVGSSKNKTATVFIGLFGAGFVLLAGYSYYLKTKLERAKINLSE